MASFNISTPSLRPKSRRQCKHIFRKANIIDVHRYYAEYTYISKLQSLVDHHQRVRELSSRHQTDTYTGSTIPALPLFEVNIVL